MPNLGAPELLVVGLTWLLFTLLPLAALIWGVLTLVRMRRGQQEVLVRLAALERALYDRRP